MGNILLANYKLIYLDKISSTQIYSHKLIADGNAVDRTVVVANVQTAGYGRYKRKWISDNGNLYASYIYEVEHRNPTLSYSVAVAVAETLIHFGITPSIKWPNDILISGKKVCGILIEYSRHFVIIGIGINIKSSPKNLQYETTKLQDYADVEQTDLIVVLIKKLEFWINKDFSIVRERWTDLAIALNDIITYRGTKAQLIGINEDGALVLRVDSKYIITYGDEISL